MSLITILLITNINTTIIHAQATSNNSKCYEHKKSKAYTDHHMHMMSQEFSEVFKSVLGSDTYIDIPIEEVSGDSIIALLDEAEIDKAFVLSGSYILGMDELQSSTEYEDVKKRK